MKNKKKEDILREIVREREGEREREHRTENRERAELKSMYGFYACSKNVAIRSIVARRLLECYKQFIRCEDCQSIRSCPSAPIWSSLTQSDLLYIFSFLKNLIHKC